jgi:D-proline reductase (dithiol) PrdB
VGLVARHVEAAGIPTLCMSSALDITRSVNPPRAAFLDFPLGHTTGKPDQPELQRRILVDALSSFEAMTVPGSVRTLPYRWSDDEGWKEKAFAEGDGRRPRHDTPQYQEEADRSRAR